MEKGQIVSEIKSGVKLSTRVIAVLALLLALGFVYIRTHPKWEDAELAIEPANRDFKIESLVPEGKTLSERIVPPEGFERLPAEKGSFTEYLRNYPLLPDDVLIPTFKGQTISTKSYNAGVFDISLEKDGYQQCADSVIRLYSDYFYETGQFDKISFQFSNGQECNYDRWKKGKRIFAVADFSVEIPAALPDSSKQQYMNYLKQVMRYAGTLSLQKESEVIPSDDIRVGDIICNDTHVVLVVDEAVNDKGEKCYLIGQSFIPSVCFHILTYIDGTTEYPWYTQEQLSQDEFVVGTFAFRKENIRRWKDGF